MNLKMILKLLGIKKENLAEKIFALIFAFGEDTVEAEIRRMISRRMSPAMRADAVLALNGIAQALAKNNDALAAQQITALLAQIKV